MDYSTVKTRVANYLNRSDLTTYIAEWVNFGQRKIEKVSNFIGMEENESDTLSEDAYTIDIPTGYKSTRSMYMIWEDQKYPVTKATEKELFDTRSNLTIDIGRPLIFCPREEDDSIWFRPTADQDYTYYHNFYKYSAALASSDDTNWITDGYPELLIYMALMEAEPYIMKDGRIQTWAKMAAGLMEDLVGAENQRDFSPDMVMYAT